MRAIRFHRIGSPDVLVYEEVTEPSPAAGEVRVDVRAIGVNYADIHIRRGEYFVKPRLPDMPGLEAAGVVDALGEGVTELALGQRVAITGPRAYAEKMVAPAKKVYPLPDGLSFEDAAGLVVPGLTAALVLTRVARMKPGAKVLVHAAAGGVGSLAVQLARLEGASLVIGTTTSAEKIPVLDQLGVDVALASPADLAVAVKRASPGGVDVILEMVGGASSYKSNLACLAPWGHLVVYGAASGDVRGTIEPVGLMAKNLSVSGFYLTPIVEDGELCARELAKLAERVVSGAVRLLRGCTFPLSEAAAAHRLLESRKSIGKIVLVTETATRAPPPK